MDVLTPEQRRWNMRRIRGKDTKPEVLIRRGLHAAGLRFRLHSRQLPGRPDLIFPRYSAAIFVNGCFWHGHDCTLCKIPATRRTFWTAKIARNAERDRQVIRELLSSSWRVLIVWECSLRGRGRQSVDQVIARCEAFIRNPKLSVWELRGNNMRERPANGLDGIN